MMLLKMITASIGLANQSFSTVNNNDFLIENDETKIFSLKSLNQTQAKVYFQAIVLLNRYSFRDEQNFSKKFESPGTYNMTLTYFDPTSQTMYSKKVFSVKGNDFYFYFMTFFI